jgi:hypothetical protein
MNGMDKPEDLPLTIVHAIHTQISTKCRKTRVNPVCEFEKGSQQSGISQLPTASHVDGCDATFIVEEDTNNAQSSENTDDAGVSDIGSELGRLSLNTLATGTSKNTTGQIEMLNDSRRHPSGPVLGCREPSKVSLSLEQTTVSLWQAVLSSSKADGGLRKTLPIFRPGTRISDRCVHKSTVAVLDRGQDKPLLASVSGWSHVNLMKHQLDQTHWTYKVFELCAEINHKLKNHHRDQHNGRFHASHAEKQLLAFSYFNPPNGEQRSDRRRRLKIYVTQLPCDDCTLCFRTFADVTNSLVIVKTGKERPKIYKRKRLVVTIEESPKPCPNPV